MKTFRFVQALKRIQDFAAAQSYLVKKTYSVVDIIKDMNCSFHNNDKAFYRLPDSDEEVSQLLLLYEMSGGEEFERLVSADMSTARLTVCVQTTDTGTSKRFHDDLVAFIESIRPDAYTYGITGVSFLVLEANRYTAQTQLKSIILALAIVSLMMTIVFRSFTIGVISMFPNIFPILITLAFMGFTGIWLDSMKTLIASIAIGLAVDDTIHFMSRYRLEFSRLRNYGRALDTEVGRAITITTIILVIGFGSATVSKLNDVFYFGMLSAMCIFLALLADYFLCPALILFFRPFGKEEL